MPPGPGALSRAALPLRGYQQRLLLLYGLTVVLGTLVQTTFDLPESVFSNKRNPLNQIFVKMGWVMYTLPGPH